MSNASAQGTPGDSLNGWKTGGTAGLNFSQVGLKNWSGGGQNTIGIAGITSLFAKLTQGASEWGNTFDGGYGFTKLDDGDFRKSDDKLIAISRYGYRISNELLATCLLDLRTQFTPGYNYDRFDSVLGDYDVISRFLAPGYVTLGVGATWKPVDYFELLVAPLSNRAIIVLDDSLSNRGAFGVEQGEKFKSEFGSLLNATVKREVFTNVVLGSRLSAFAPYQDFTSVIVTWESLFVFKVNDFMNASLGIDLIYDPKVTGHRDDGTIGPRLQFRDVIALGIGYTF